MSNIQSWIERADPPLFGENGNPGLIIDYAKDRAARIQKEQDMELFMKRRVQWVTFIAGAVSVLKILEIIHIIPK